MVIDAAVTLNSASSGSGGNINFSGTVDATSATGAELLTINTGTSGDVDFNGAVGSSQGLDSLTIDADVVTFDNTTNIGGSLDIDAGGTVDFSGNLTTTNNGNITISNTGTLTINGNVNAAGKFDQDAAGGVGLNGDITVGSTIDVDGTLTLAQDVVLTASGNTTLSTVTGASNSLNIINAAVFGGNVSGVTTLDVGGTAAINASSIATTGRQDYVGATTLGVDAVLSGTNITFGSTVNGTSAGLQSLNITGNALFSGTVGAGTSLEFLTVSGTADIDGGNITTTGIQTYTGRVELGADTSLNGSTITFGSTLNGASAGQQSLAITGDVVFNNVVGGSSSLEFLTVSGQTALDGGDVTTAGIQTFTGATTLGADTVLTGTNVSFGSTLNGGQNLTINASGQTSFGSTVGNSSALASLTTDANGNVTFNGNVTTVGTQTFNDAATLLAGATFESTGDADITFSSTLNGAQVLTVNTSGNTTFGGIVGGSTALTSLTTDTGGTTNLNGGNVTTSGAQTFNDAVSLGADATLNATTVSFISTLNGGRNLIIDATSANFDAVVGGSTPLTSLSVSGVSDLGANLTTSGVQAFSSNVTLSADITLTGTNVTFGSAVDSDGTARDLTIAATGATTFNGIVGGGSALDTLAASNGGTTVINTSAITAAVIDIDDAAVIDTSTTLAGTTSIDFASTVNSATGENNGLTLNSPLTGFNADIGTTQALGALTTDAAGNTTLGSGLTAITTAGNQTFNDTVIASNNITLTASGGSDISLANAGNDLQATVAVSARNVTIVDSGALGLGASTVTGDFNVTSSGVITDSGTLAVTGTSVFLTRDDSGSNITLDDASSTFGTLTVRVLNAAGSADANGDIQLTENSDLTIDTISTTGAVSLTSSGAIVDGGDSSNDIVANSAVLTAASGIGTDANGIETTVGSLSATTASGDIHVTNTGNLLTVGGISATNGISAGGTVALTNAGGITVGENISGSSVTLTTTDTTATEDLTISSNVIITSSSGTLTLNVGDNLTIDSTAALNAGANNIDINLDFGDADSNGTNSDINGTFTANTVTIDGASNNDVIDAAGVTGVGVIINGNDGDDTLLGTAQGDTVNGGNGNDSILGNAGNDLLAGGNGDDLFTWNNGDDTDTVAGGADTDTLIVNGSSADDTFAISASSGGNFDLARTNFGTFNIDASTVENLNLNTLGGNDDVTLNDLSTVNDLSAISLDGGADTDALTINSSNLDNLIITFNAGNSQTINLGSPSITHTNFESLNSTVVAGNLTFDINTNQVDNITLSDTGTNVDNRSILTSNNGSIQTTTFTSPTNLLTVTTGIADDIITLETLDTQFGANLTVSGEADNDTINFGSAASVSLPQNVSVTAETIAQANGITIAGTATFDAGTGSITLNDAANDFSTVTISAAANATLRDSNEINLGASTLSGTLDLTAGSNVSQSGVLTAGTLVLTNAGGTTTLDQANVIGNLGGVNATGGDFSLVNSAALTLTGAITAGSNDVSISTSTNAVTFVLGGADITAGNLSITAQDVDGLNTTGTFNTNITLAPDSNADTMALSSADGLDFTLTTDDIAELNSANGEITLGQTSQSGSLTLGAAADFGARTVTINSGNVNDSVNTLTADTLTLNLTSPAQNVIVADTTTALNVNTTTGTGSGQSLTVTDADAVTLGTINTGSGTFLLHAGGTVGQSGTITASSLGVNATDAITLTNANDVDTVALVTTNGNVAFTDADGFTVGTVTVSGISTASGTVDLTATTGNVTLNSSSSDISATGLISIVLGGDDALLDVSDSGASIASAGGVSIEADKINLVGTINATAANITITNDPTEADAIDLGSNTDNAVDTLELSDAELDNITTTGVLILGSSNVTGINVSSAISPANVSTVHLKTGGAITQSAGITETNLAITATGLVTLTSDNSVTNLAVSHGAALQFSNNGDLTLGSIDGLTGVSSTNQDATISSTGSLNIANAISIGNGNATLTAGGSLTGAATVIAGSLNATAQNEIDLNTNVTNLQASTSAGNIGITEADTLTVNGNGVQATGGNVDITTGSNLTLAAVVSASGSGTVSLTVNNAGSELITNAGANITSGSGDITITADVLTLAGNIGSSGALLLQPLTASSTMGVGGGAGTFDIGDSELALLNDGFSSITIGRSDSSGTLTVDSSTFSDPVTLRTSGGTINVTGNITVTGNASVTLDANTTINLSADITTAGGLVTFNDNVVIDDPISLSTTNGDVSFLGTVDATSDTNAESLTINSGTGGDVRFTGAVGNSQALDAVTIDSRNVTLSSTASIAGTLDIDAAGTVDFTNNVTTTNSGNIIVSNTGELTINGDVNAAGVFNQDAAGGVGLNGDITAGSTIDIDGTLTLAQDVTLNGTTTTLAVVDGASNSLNITANGILNGAVSNVTTLTIGSNATINANVSSTTLSVSGTTGINATTITTTGAQSFGGAVALSTDVTLSATGVTFSSTVDSSGGARDLIINDDGATRFDGVVGGISALDTLITNAAGNTTINASNVTAAVINVNDSLILDSDVALTGTTSVSLAAIDSASGETNALTVNSPLTTFNGAIGNTDALSNLTTDAAGNTTISTASLNITGNQLFQDDVLLNANARFSGGNITFGSIEGLGVDRDLTVSATSTINLGVVGSGGNIDSIDLDAATLNLGGNVTGQGSIVIDVANALVVGFDITSGNTTAITVTAADTGAPVFTLNGGSTIDSSNGQFSLQADDVSIAGTINAAGQTALFRSNSDGNNIILGGNSTTLASLELTDTELDNVTATTIRVGHVNAGNLTISAAIDAANTDILSLITGGTVSQTAAVTESNLAIQAAGAVTMTQANSVGTLAIDTSTGDISFTNGSNLTIGTVDGVTGVDTDNGSATLNVTGDLVMSQLVSAANGSISATASGSIDQTSTITTTGNGTVTLNAGDEITISAISTVNGDVIATSANSSITVSAGIGGINATGSADITLNADTGITLNDAINASGGNVTLDADVDGDGVGTITANADIAAAGGDIDLEGGIITQTSGRISTNGNGTIALDANGDITLIDIDSVNGDVAVTSADNAIILSAGGGGLNVSGTGGVTLSADTGITLSDDVTTNGGNVSFDTDVDNNGAGDMTIAAAANVTTGNGALNITANDIDLDGSLNSGNGTTTVLVSDGGSIGLGAAVGDLTIDDAEFGRIAAGNLVLGNSTGNITVNGVTEPNSNGITGTVTLNAVQASFSGTASTFNALAVNALDGLNISAAITTDTGNLALEGDANNTAETIDGIAIAAGLTVQSAGSLTLDATNGNITALGSVTLNANAGVSINDDISTNGTTTIDADLDDSGAGTFTLTGALTSNSNTVVITAADVALNAALAAGTANITIQPSTAASIGLGVAAGSLALSNAEIANISTIATLTIGNVTLASAINADDVAAGTLNVALTTAGTIDDTDDANTNFTTSGTLTLTSGAAIGSANAQGFHIDVATVTVTASGGSNVTLTNAVGSDANYDITTGGAGDVTITQVNNNLGIRTVTTNGNAALTASNGDITDADLDVASDINAAALTLTAKGNLGTSAASADLDTNVDSITANSTAAGTIVIDEVNALTVTGLTTADGDITVTTDGQMVVNGAVAAGTNGTVNLTAASGSDIDVNVNAIIASSGTGTVSLTAENGIDVGAAVSTAGTNITLDADSDNNAEGTATFSGAGTLLSSAGGDILVTADDFVISGAGNIDSGAGNITLEPSTAITIRLGTGNGDFSVSDAEFDAIFTTGLLTIGNSAVGNITAGAVTADAKNVLLITAASIDDNGDGASNFSTTGTLTLTSGAAIGAANSQGFNMDVNSLVVTSSNGNNITLTDAGSSDTNFSIATGGAGTVTVTQANNDLAIQSITTSGNAILAASSGDITDADLDAAADVSANSLTLTATGNIGTSAANADIDTTVASITANSTTVGDIVIDETNALTVNGLTTTSGNITLTADGDTAISGAVSAGGSGFVSLTAATANADLTVNAAISTAGTGSVSLTADANGVITLSNNITTDGGDVATTGLRTVLGASATIDTEVGGDANAGDVNLSATPVSANAAGLTLTINADGNSDGGSVILPVFNNAGGQFVNALSINTNGTANDGTLTLNNNISLDAGDFTLTGGGDVIIAASLTIDTEQGNDASAGAVNLGNSNVYGNAANFDLTINTQTGLAAGQGGNVTFGLVDNNAGNNSFLRNLSVLTSANTDGIVSLGNGIFIEGDVTFDGDVRLSASITIDTEQGTDGAGSILMTGASISGTGAGRDLSLDATSAGSDGQIVLGQFSNAGGSFVNDLSLNTAGNVSITTSISLEASGNDAGDLSVTGGGLVIVTGNTIIDTETGGDANAGSVNFGASILTANAANDLTINTVGNTDGGTVTIAGADNSGGAFIDDLAITTNSTNSGTINLNGTITTNGNQSYDSGTIGLPKVNVLSNNGSVTLSSNITAAAAVSITAGQNINLNGADTIDAGGQDVTLTASGFNASGGLTTQNVDDLNFNISGTASVKGTVSINGATLSAGTGTLNSNNNSVDLNLTGVVDLDLDINTGGASFQVSGTNFDNTNGDVRTAGGEIRIQSAGALTIGGDLNADSGNITLGEATSMTGGGTIFGNTLTGLNATSNTFVINGAGGVGTLNTVAIDITNITGGSNADIIRIDGGTLPGIISAGGGNDNITILNAGRVAGNIINGDAGQDNVTIDISGGNNATFVNGLVYNGGDPSTVPGDSLNITNGSFNIMTHTATNPSEGNVDLDGALVSYTGLEPVFLIVQTQTINFKFDGGNENVTVNDFQQPNDGLSFVDSTQGEQVVFLNSARNLNIDTKAGNDTVDFIGRDQNSSSDVTITAQNNLTVSNVNVQNSSVSIQSTGGTLTTGAITAGTVSTSAQGNLNAGNINASGSVTQTSSAGSVTAGTTTSAGGSITQQALTGSLTAGVATAGGSVTQIALNTLNTQTVNAGGSVSQSSTAGVADLGAVTSTGGSITQSASSNLNAGTVNANGSVTQSSTNGSLSAGSATAGSSVSQTSRNNLTAGAVNAGSNVNQTSNQGSVSTSSVSAGGSTSISALGSVNTNGNNLSSGGSTTINSTAGTVSTNNINSTSGSTSITTNNQNISTGAVTSGNALNVNSGGGSINLGNSSSTGNASVNSGGGSITTGNFSANDATLTSNGGTVNLNNVSTNEFSIDGGGVVSFQEITATGDVSLISLGGTISLRGDTIFTRGELLIDTGIFTTADATLTSSELTLDAALQSLTNGIIDLDAGIVNFENNFTIVGGTSVRTQAGGVEGKNVQLGAEVVVELPVIEVEVIDQPEVNAELIALLEQFGIKLEGVDGLSTKILEPLPSERTQLGSLPTPLQTAQAMSRLDDRLNTTPDGDASDEFKRFYEDYRLRLMDSDDPLKTLEEFLEDEFVKNSPKARAKLKALANLPDMALKVENADDPDATFKALRQTSPWLMDAQSFLAQARALLIQKGKDPKFAAQLFMVNYAKPIQAAFPTTYGLLQQMAAE